MALVNLTRTRGKHKVETIEAFHCVLDVLDEVGTTGDDYQLAILPPKTLIKSVSVIVEVSNDSGGDPVADIGVDGDDSIVAAFDLSAAADTVSTDEVGVYLPLGGVLTYTPTYDGTPTQGRIRLHVEYSELGKTSGAFTKFLEEDE